MPPSIDFDHTNPQFSTGLAPTGLFRVGQSTEIVISLLNSGDEDGVVDVRLYWNGPAAGVPAGSFTSLLGILDPPIVPIIFSVNRAAGGVPTMGSMTVSWTPSASFFPNTHGAPIHGCLFAQAVVQPVAPDYAGDASALGIWDPNYALCAQHSVMVYNHRNH